MAALYAPLLSFRSHPRGGLRTDRGRRGLLLLHRSGLSPHTPCRSPGASAFVDVPETVRVLTQRSTLLGAGGSKSRSRQANGANSRSLENVLASAERPDGASGNRKFESISLQRRVQCEPDFRGRSSQIVLTGTSDKRPRRTRDPTQRVSKDFQH